ncbi:MAG: tRNA (5-methylaminomethyl-2-thiouridine)(34)-methyltransferase MnmD [Cyclobacteriaceae bacterium]|nr:tRNA (5-methylaminomethyl-2-thiouridine)(34)-methyltransferase MnmD [Cyclobacteriaceae bacterium]
MKQFITEDGSSSLYNEHLRESYHSTHGAWQESVYVYIERGLQKAFEKFDDEEIRVFEVGFGTGLNALLSLIEARNNSRKVLFDSLEPFPIISDLVKQLHFPKLDEEQRTLFTHMHAQPMDSSFNYGPFFSLEKKYLKLEDFQASKGNYHVIYFDAFAPSKQPELWEKEMLQKVVDALARGGVFVTYSAKGQLKRDLASLGMTVESLSGPPGKMEMVRAMKL